MRDFTLNVYKLLCEALIYQGFQSVTISDYLLANSNKKYVLLRHDVDKKPYNALRVAEIENSLGISSTFYFRTTSEVFIPSLIQDISRLGHEIGYHYEVLAKSKGKYEDAIKLFEKELNEFREIVEIRTICMHGSPYSPHKDSDLWNRYDYTKFGLESEAFLSLDYNKILYYTDTGRSWNGDRFNVRDQVETVIKKPEVKTTFDLVNVLSTIKSSISINSHPQRWNDNMFSWFSEYVLQNFKNQFKKVFLKNRD